MRKLRHLHAVFSLLDLLILLGPFGRHQLPALSSMLGLFQLICLLRLFPEAILHFQLS